MPRSFPNLDVAVEQITAGRLKTRLDRGQTVTMIDTRPPEDFAQWQITHPNLTVRNVPFDAFLDRSGERPAPAVPSRVPEGPLVTACAIGQSSFYVAQFLTRQGYDAVALKGGMEAWAELNERRQLRLNDTTLVQFHRPSSGCLAYLLVAEQEAAVVDPLRAFAGEYAAVAAEYNGTLRYAIDTHVHADHVSGVRRVGEQSGATVVHPDGASERGLTDDARFVTDGASLPLGATSITARALPGHTTEMMGYQFGDALLTGDSLFLDSVARPDLENADRAREAAETLWETARKLDELPDKTVLAPGHVGPTTTPRSDGSFAARLAEVRQRLRIFEEPKEPFVERVVANLPPRPPNDETIIAVNLGERRVDDEAAFELELGPNNCAVGE